MVLTCVLNHSLVLNRTLSFTFQTTEPGSNPLQDNVRTCLPTQEISEQLSIIYTKNKHAHKRCMVTEDPAHLCSDKILYSKFHKVLWNRGNSIQDTLISQ